MKVKWNSNVSAHSMHTNAQTNATTTFFMSSKDTTSVSVWWMFLIQIFWLAIYHAIHQMCKGPTNAYGMTGHTNWHNRKTDLWSIQTEQNSVLLIVCRCVK